MDFRRTFLVLQFITDALITNQKWIKIWKNVENRGKSVKKFQKIMISEKMLKVGIGKPNEIYHTFFQIQKCYNIQGVTGSGETLKQLSKEKI